MEVFKGQGNDTDTSEEFEKYLQDQGMLHSFSRKGNPYDNACIESFHSVLKKEEVYTTTYYTFEEAKSENARQPQCTPEKEDTIMQVFRHFGII